jgi:hypothetical protein
MPVPALNKDGKFCYIFSSSQNNRGLNGEIRSDDTKAIRTVPVQNFPMTKMSDSLRKKSCKSFKLLWDFQIHFCSFPKDIQFYSRLRGK